MRNGMIVVGILLAILATYGLLGSSSTLWDRDEPRFARATMEMVESGNYLYPTFNGRLRPDKPILIYWVMSGFIQILGPRELAFRLPSVIGMAISCYITFLIGKALSCKETGLWAMLVLGTSLMAIVEGTAATADGLLLACMMVAIWQYIKALTGRMGIAHTLVMGLALGLALLTKGPVGLLPVLVIFLAEYFLRKEQLTLTSRIWPVVGATAMAVVIFIAWALPANVATGGLFAKAGLGHHVMGRTLRPLEGHGGRWLLYLPYYLPVAIVFLFPWTLFLPAALSAFIGRRIADRRPWLILLAWICPVFLIMTIVATKLPHYVLFSWPALAILIARLIVLASKGQLHQKDLRFIRLGVFLYGALVIAAAIGLALSGWILHINSLPGIVAAGVVALTAIVAIALQLKGRTIHCSYVLIVGSIALLVVIAVMVMPAIEQAKISPQLVEALQGQIQPDVPIATYGYAEPSLNFYLGRKIEDLKDQDQLRIWIQRPGTGVLILPENAVKTIEDRLGLVNLRTIASVSGYNYSKGHRTTVLALAKGLIDG